MADEQKNMADEAEVMPASQEIISPVENMEEPKPVEQTTEPVIQNAPNMENQTVTEAPVIAEAQAIIVDSNDLAPTGEVMAEEAEPIAESPIEAAPVEETPEVAKVESVDTPVVAEEATQSSIDFATENPVSTEPIEEVKQSEEIKAEAEEIKNPEAGYEKAKIKSNTIISIVIILALVLGLVFWLTRDNNSDNSDAGNPNGKIVVSDAPEQGKVTIIEEVKDQLKVASGGTATFNNTNPNSAKMAVTVFVGNTRKNPNSADCAQVYPVNRQAEKRYESNMINTVLSLLEPISTTEKENGYISVIPAGTFLQYIKIDDSGVATANFSGSISKVAGSCAVTAIKSQIKNTLIQFASVKSVVICIDGNCNQAEILQP
jgi:hypothetical protein